MLALADFISSGPIRTSAGSQGDGTARTRGDDNGMLYAAGIHPELVFEALRPARQVRRDSKGPRCKVASSLLLLLGDLRIDDEKSIKQRRDEQLVIAVHEVAAGQGDHVRKPSSECGTEAVGLTHAGDADDRRPIERARGTGGRGVGRGEVGQFRRIGANDGYASVGSIGRRNTF